MSIRDGKGRFQKTELTKEDLNNIKTDFENGMKIKDIRKKYKIGAVTSRKLLPRRRRKDMTKEIIKKLRNDYFSGISIKEILNKYNISPGSLYKQTKANREPCPDSCITFLKKMNPLNPKLFYIAGFIDADGGISVIKSFPKWYKGKPYFSSQLTACNTNKQVIKEIKNFFRWGSIFKIKPNPKHRQYRKLYRWCVNNQKVIEQILILLYNKLIVKQKRADLVLQIINAKKEKNIEKQKEIYQLYRNEMEKN